MVTLDIGALASAGVKLINAAGVHPIGAGIIVVGTLVGLLIWAWSKK